LAEPARAEPTPQAPSPDPPLARLDPAYTEWSGEIVDATGHRNPQHA
jgi:hypothetical protein